MDRRADRRPLSDARPGDDRDPEEVVHVHQRRSRGLPRPDDVQPLVRLPADLCRQAETRAEPDGEGAGTGPVPGVHRRPRRDASRRPDPAGARPGFREGGLRGPEAGPDPVRQRRRRDPVQTVPRLRAFLLRLPAVEHEAAVLVPLRQRQAGCQARQRGRPVHLGSRGAAADRLQR